jgi:hypothetical protein
VFADTFLRANRVDDGPDGYAQRLIVSPGDTVDLAAAFQAVG